jgi:ketosteroid isomerase-like protein
MKRSERILFLTAILTAGLVPVGLAASSATISAIAPAEARVMCDNANKQFTVGLSQGNPVAITALYSSDALLQSPGGTEATKREAIANFWQHQMDDGATGLALSIDALAVEGELVIETGRYALISGQVGVVETGKYLIVRKREAGQWRIFRHIWNASQSSSSSGS